MLRLLKKIFTVVVLVATVQQVRAFSLNGLAPAWQTQAIGYGGVIPGGVQPIGGPLNLGEEYRWNLPIIFYGADSPHFYFNINNWHNI